MKVKGDNPKIYNVNDFMFTFVGEFMVDKYSGFDGLTEYLESLYVAPFDSDPTVEDTDRYDASDDLDSTPICKNEYM